MKRIAQFGLGKLSIFATVVSVLCVLAVYGQNMFSSGPLSEQKPRKTARGGISSHAEITNCAACHAPAWSSDSMASRCMDCHDNIRDQLDNGKAMHGLLAHGEDCRSCHTEHKGPHGKLTSFKDFDHGCTAFKLTGKHRALDCAACHHDKPFQGTPQSCVSCHAEPAAHKGKFGTDCMSCHSPETWQTTSFKTDLFTSSKFDHACTGFALTGKHATTDCKSCHKGGAGVAFKGLSQSCVSCHAEPIVHKGKFGTDCRSCHLTSDFKTIKFAKEVFTSVRFDHDTTAFKLTGKHASADCKSCHTGNTFKGTPTFCVSCHTEPISHRPYPKTFGVQCADCHSTTTWKGASLAQARHRFPINHGNKKNKSADNSCSLCHPKDHTFVSTSPTTNYDSYTCFGCHHHSLDKEKNRHAGRKVPDLNRCADCHKGVVGKKGKAGRLKDASFLSDVLEGCPEASCVEFQADLLPISCPSHRVNPLALLDLDVFHARPARLEPIATPRDPMPMILQSPVNLRDRQWFDLRAPFASHRTPLK
jgi:hypothetical protein